MRRFAIGVAVAALMLAGAACTNDEGSGSGSSSSGVPWSDYAPDLQSRIDGLAAGEDCAGLQDEFDIADANSDATLDRTGHTNADLLGYIGDALQAAGCYG